VSHKHAEKNAECDVEPVGKYKPDLLASTSLTCSLCVLKVWRGKLTC